MSNPGLTNLAGYWSCDEMSGIRYDKMALAGDLTAYGSGGVTPADNFMFGVSANFVASQVDYLARPSNGTLYVGNNNFEMGCWFNPHSTGGQMRIMNKWRTAGGREYVLYMKIGGMIAFNLYDYVTSWTIEASTFGAISASSGKWYWVCAFFNATTNTIGVGVNNVWNSTAGSTIGTVNSGADFTIGIDSIDHVVDPMNGLVDEIFFYRPRTLTTENRIWLYNDGLGRSYFDIADTSPPVVTIETPTIRDVVPVYILDPDLIPVGIIEDYYSLVWAERYNEVGDFELELPISHIENPLLTFGNYLQIKTSDKIMVIENIKPTYTEEKDSILIEGESTESILKRRATDEIYTIDSDDYAYSPAERAIYKLIWQHITFPTGVNAGDPDRKIALFSEDYPAMWSTIEYAEQFDPQSIYDIITTICKNSVFTGPWTVLDYKGLGFKIVKYNDEFVFYVYTGTDRSYSQTAFLHNPYVVFSEEFQNVKSSSVYNTEKDRVTVALVLSDDVTYPSVYVWFDGTSEGPAGNEPTDMDRIEKILETDIDRSATDPVLTDAEVLAIIATRGRELINDGSNALFEGDFDIRGQFVYGVDFFLGDVVQCVLAGKNLPARVVEVVRSYSAEGRTAYLTMNYDL